MQVTIIRSKRKSVLIQVNFDGTVTVRAPKRVPKYEIDRILKEREEWIEKHLNKMEEKRAREEASGIEPLSFEDVKELAQKALDYIPQRVDYFAKIIGVEYTGLTIRNQKSRWGSCSSKGRLSFNCLLMLTPPEVIDYVVVHELCHLKEMNHSKAFWKEVEKTLPDYKRNRKWLRDEGDIIIRRQLQEADHQDSGKNE